MVILVVKLYDFKISITLFFRRIMYQPNLDYVKGDQNEHKDLSTRPNGEEAKTVIPESATQAVLVHSTPMPEGTITVSGPDFNQKLTHDQILYSYNRIGFQATSLGKAIQIINQMVIIICLLSYLFVRA